MTSQPSLSSLSVDLLFAIFKQLDRPSKLSLALSSPKILHLMAKYYDLDRYRAQPLFLQKMGVPESVSWEESKAQGAIIRWIAMPGSDDIDDPGDPGDDTLDEEEPIRYDILEEEPTLNDGFDLDDERAKPYEETKAGKEELAVQQIIGEWLRQRCGVEGGVVFCAECYRFMRLRPESGEKGPWYTEMLTRPIWFRHCGPCEDSYDIARDAIIA